MCDVVYVVSKRIRILSLQQMAAAAIKARLVYKAEDAQVPAIGTVSQRIRILSLQQMVAAAIKARLVYKAESGGEQFGGN
ncbi:hypothetical protein F2Q69_00031496 [Brassica cretica]|uniref:Uncharacterized protein n=1 Tax=Brassica cretica TaxID=69181 RepID=A0A8S9S6V7_BRACR|nr:hypothetical protein F2Q69_00031496 [Brassica cretica]